MRFGISALASGPFCRVDSVLSLCDWVPSAQIQLKRVKQSGPDLGCHQPGQFSVSDLERVKRRITPPQCARLKRPPM